MPDNLIDIDDEGLKAKVADEIEERIRKANALSFMVNTEGWNILLDTFEDMKDQQLSELSKSRPGDDKTVLSAHSVWYSVVHTLEEIKYAVSSAIRDGELAKLELVQLKHQSTEDDWS